MRKLLFAIAFLATTNPALANQGQNLEVRRISNAILFDNGLYEIVNKQTGNIIYLYKEKKNSPPQMIVIPSGLVEKQYQDKLFGLRSQ
jgi:hypothetical protein